MNSIQYESALAAFRHLLSAIGGILVAHGYTDHTTAETIAGAVAALIGIALSINHKRTGIAEVKALKDANVSLTRALDAGKPGSVNAPPTTQP